MNNDLTEAVNRLARLVAMDLVKDQDTSEKIWFLHQAGFSNTEVESMTGAARGTVSGAISRRKKRPES